MALLALASCSAPQTHAPAPQPTQSQSATPTPPVPAGPCATGDPLECASELAKAKLEHNDDAWHKLSDAYSRVGELDRANQIIPELFALIGVVQDPRWHPEGDVWTHTVMVVDAAVDERVGDEADDMALMFAALCHDLGKPETTVVEAERIHSHRHEHRGIGPTESFLQRLRAPNDLVEQVCALVKNHLAPVHFHKNGAKPRAYRKLARKLGDAGTNIELLMRVVRADQFGRTTAEAKARQFPGGDAFWVRARDLGVHDRAPIDRVLGRHLIARGLKPGLAFKDLLSRCRDVQDETGWTDTEQILDRVLDKKNSAPGPE